MKKRLLSLVMVLALVLSLCPAALAAGPRVRKTDFFKDNNAAKRTDLNFSEINYEEYGFGEEEEARFYELYENILALMGTGTEENGFNADAIAEDFAEFYDLVELTWTMCRYTTITGYQNYAREDAWDDYNENYGYWYWVKSDSQDSENPGSWVWYEAYTYWDEETQSWNEEGKEYWVPGTWDDDMQEYGTWNWYSGPYYWTWDYFYYVVYELREAGYKEILKPYFNSDDPTNYCCLDYYWSEYEQYDYGYDVNSELLDEYESYIYWKDYYVETYGREEYYSWLGGIYLKMIDNWNNEAVSMGMGYDNYMEYIYAYYGRDYTPEEIREFEDAVKKYLVPIYLALGERNADIDLYSGVFAADYTSDAAVRSIRPYLADMSSELLDSFNYMVKHGMYDFRATKDKYYGGAYTDWFYSFGTPFIFSDPYTGSYNVINFSTIVHEFGHYNAMYYDPMGFTLETKAEDIMEVHSQGLELLMTEYYPKLFGKQADEVTSYFMAYFLGNIVWQCIRDEFEQYAFTADELTVQSLNRKYYELEVKYGIISAETAQEDGEDASWMEINHFFSYPCYLISYATSLSGAFSFWLEAQDDFYGAVDDYLRFCALDVDLGFEESFAKVGVESPISPEYVKDLADELTAVLLTEEPDDPYIPAYPSKPDTSTDTDTPDTPDEPDEPDVPDVPAASFLDVPDDAWYRDAVNYVTANGLMEGVGGGQFAPELNLSRSQIVTILYRLEGEPTVSGASGFSDVADGTWYTDAVTWAAASGIVNGYDGVFGPGDDITRQDMAAILYRYAQYKGYDVSVGEDTNILSYPDAESVSDYAFSALQWACGSGIIQGTDTGALAPIDSTSRAVFATILMRFAEL